MGVLRLSNTIDHHTLVQDQAACIGGVKLNALPPYNFLAMADSVDGRQMHFSSHSVGRVFKKARFAMWDRASLGLTAPQRCLDLYQFCIDQAYRYGREDSTNVRTLLVRERYSDSTQKRFSGRSE